MRPLVIVLTIGCLAASAAGETNDDAAHNWPQWRGPDGSGVAPHAEPPLEWSDEQNIRWKTALPGRGHATPVIWGDRIFLTAAIPFGERFNPRYSGAPGAHDNEPVRQRHKFVVIAVDRRRGAILWQRTVNEQLPHEGAHNTASLASASPITDGERVFAFFGSHGLSCLNNDGQVQWKKDLGRMQTKHGHGEGSSPVMFGETLVVNWDHEGESFVTALDKRTGVVGWRIAREEVTSWATPLAALVDGQPQVIVSGTSRVRGYSLNTGKVIWQCGGLSDNIVASPVYGDGMLFAGSSYDKRALLAIRLKGARGDITGTDHVVWNRFRGTPYVPSPLLYGDALYFLTHYQGILTGVDAKTGDDRPGAMRLAGIRNVYASPIGAAGRIYITDRDGTTLVMSHGDIPRILARNRINDTFNASAAAVGKELFLRGEKYLYCIADE